MDVSSPPIEVKVVEPIKSMEETITYNDNPVIPTAYVEKPPFPVRIKEHAKVLTVVNKAILEHLNLLNKSK